MSHRKEEEEEGREEERAVVYKVETGGGVGGKWTSLARRDTHRRTAPWHPGVGANKNKPTYQQKNRQTNKQAKRPKLIPTPTPSVSYLDTHTHTHTHIAR